MNTTPRSIQNLEVFVEGNGPQTVLMLHGWPDTHRLWDSTVQTLAPQFQCVRLSLPGFDLEKPARPTSLADMNALLLAVVDSVSPGAPVTLLMHDWGCMFGYEFAARHPERVARIVAVDIGDHNSTSFQQSLSSRAKWQILSYQIWLALAWYLGQSVNAALGNRMTRWMARALRYRANPQAMGWQMNYPYAMQWFGLAGGFKQAAPIAPHCPTLYIYGARKPFMFHSPAWLAELAARPGNSVQPFNTGHWVMVDQTVAFNTCVQQWLTPGANPAA
jgi:pimeloyl-ACP methyl ester carboxylesterase